MSRITERLIEQVEALKASGQQPPDKLLGSLRFNLERDKRKKQRKINRWRSKRANGAPRLVFGFNTAHSNKW